MAVLLAYSALDAPAGGAVLYASIGAFALIVLVLVLGRGRLARSAAPVDIRRRPTGHASAIRPYVANTHRNQNAGDKDRHGFGRLEKAIRQEARRAAVTAAFAAAGVKKVPKLDEDDTDVRIPLKGTGLEIVMTDEAFLKELDLEIGAGPLIVSGVLAKCGKSHGRDLHRGALPYGLSANFSRDAVRKLLGRPTSTDEDLFVDIWARKRLEIVVRYTRGGESISTFAMMLPGAE